MNPVKSFNLSTLIYGGKHKNPTPVSYSSPGVHIHVVWEEKKGMKVLRPDRWVPVYGDLLKKPSPLLQTGSRPSSEPRWTRPRRSKDLLVPDSVPHIPMIHVQRGTDKLIRHLKDETPLPVSVSSGLTSRRCRIPSWPRLPGRILTRSSFLLRH